MILNDSADLLILDKRGFFFCISSISELSSFRWRDELENSMEAIVPQNKRAAWREQWNLFIKCYSLVAFKYMKWLLQWLITMVCNQRAKIFLFFTIRYESILAKSIFTLNWPPWIFHITNMGQLVIRLQWEHIEENKFNISNDNLITARYEKEWKYAM